MRKRLLGITTLAAATIVVAVPALAAPEEGLSPSDKAFISGTATADLTEIHLGDLAARQGGSDAVREYGRWMMSTHSFLSRELGTITERMHGDTPTEKLGTEAEAAMTKLEGLKGEAFDKAYLKEVIEDHKKALAAVEKEAIVGHDFLVKTFAENVAIAVRAHLAQAESLQADIEGKGRAAAGVKATEDAVGGVAPVPGTPK